MAERNAEPGSGDVTIQLYDEEVTLVPTLEACRQISKLAGESLSNAVNRLNRLDFDFTCEVIALGSGNTSAPLRKQIAEKVFRAGLIAVAADCILYIRVIMNGGTRPPEDEAATVLGLLDRLGSALPDYAKDHIPALEALRTTLLEKLDLEEDGRTEDPLAERESALENSTAS